MDVVVRRWTHRGGENFTSHSCGLLAGENGRDIIKAKLELGTYRIQAMGLKQLHRKYIRLVTLTMLLGSHLGGEWGQLIIRYSSGLLSTRTPSFIFVFQCPL